MIIERWELEEAREEMQPRFVEIDAEVVAENSDACPDCKGKLFYEGLKSNNSYPAFAVCPNCDYTEEF